jgi:hypothetical protein
MLVEGTLRERRLSALWITHSDEQERRIAVRTIVLGPQENGGTIRVRERAGHEGQEEGNGDSTWLRKKKGTQRRPRSQDQGGKRQSV